MLIPLFLLTVLLTILKVSEVIDWSWWIILLPVLCLPFIFVLIVAIATFIVLRERWKEFK